MYYFFLGTEAELIKIFPIMVEMDELGIEYKVIASGQNDLTHSRVMKQVNDGVIDVQLSKEADIKKSAMGLLAWYFRTRKKSIEYFKKANVDSAQKNIMIVHGDTISTVMGAYLGKRFGMEVAHIEAGLRSHNYLNPFPEEIDRALVSRIANYNFAPGDIATSNLKKAAGQVINTRSNTLRDALDYSEKIEIENEIVTNLVSQKTEKPFFVFVMHRQENVANTAFFKDVVNTVIGESNRRHMVIILHKITENKLIEIGKLKELEDNKNITLLPRTDYFDFMKLLQAAEFVITDGGSNQEELSYMGKPCFIMRKNTERNEGIGKNAVLLGDDGIESLRLFIANYPNYITNSNNDGLRPSRQIVEVLQKVD